MEDLAIPDLSLIAIPKEDRKMDSRTMRGRFVQCPEVDAIQARADERQSKGMTRYTAQDLATLHRLRTEEVTLGERRAKEHLSLCMGTTR